MALHKGRDGKTYLVKAADPAPDPDAPAQTVALKASEPPVAE
jgi:hypothetical protein